MIKKNKKVLKEIKNLWNHEPYVKKYKDTKYTNKNPEMRHMENRMRTVTILLKKNLVKNARILELGLGAGQSARKFLNAGYNYTGMDISSSLIKFAKEKKKKYLKKLHFMSVAWIINCLLSKIHLMQL